ncbi:MAG: hypothetical protein ACHBN1_19850 [Heteroscytonema crispum UTEX LB 1556]
MNSITFAETRRQTPQVGRPAHGAGSNIASLHQLVNYEFKTNTKMPQLKNTHAAE